MSAFTNYAGIAIIEISPDQTVNIESISVTSDECVLSGAWNFSISETMNIQNVLDGKMIIGLGDKKQITQLLNNQDLLFLDAASFLEDAKAAASQALTSYEAFKAQDPVKRKKLVTPSFYDWPKEIDFNLSIEHLESIGKMATPINTPLEFRKVLAAARLVKLLVDMWRADEQERNNRKYVEGEDAKVTILPESWLLQASRER